MRYELNAKQRRQVNALIKKYCANYIDGYCIALDYGYGCVCPQKISYSLLCKYFKSSVLPNNPTLEKAILNKSKTHNCILCGKEIIRTSNRKKYCTDCAKKMQKLSKSKYIRKIRENSR